MTIMNEEEPPYGELVPVRSDGVNPWRAVDRYVSDSTIERIKRAPAKNTLKSYETWWTHFERWCDDEERTAIPATPETFAEYVAYMSDLNLAPSSIRLAMAAIRTKHRRTGFKDTPDTEAALLVLTSHKKDRADAGLREKKAPPITVEMLRQMVDTCDKATLGGLRDQVVLVLGLAMMGRRSEIVGLMLNDVSETEQGIEVLIRQSKTDKDAKGETVAIPFGQHLDTCPVRVVRAWRERLAGLGVTDGKLVRSCSRHGKVGRSLTGDSVNGIVRKRARLAGMDNAGDYSAHSLRSGGATAAYRAGAPVSAIAEHGRWNDKSPVVLGYIRAVDKWKDNPMRGIGL